MPLTNKVSSYVTFEDWFFTVDVPWAKQLNEEKVIIGDNLSSHLSPQVVKACERENIAFVCLPPNSTHLCQPLDVAVYSSLKIHWRAVLSKWKLGAGKNKPTLPKDLFPNQLRKLLESMGDCNKTNILSGFSYICSCLYIIIIIILYFRREGTTYILSIVK